MQSKPSGIPPSGRSGLSIAVAANNHAYAFGGVHDDEVDDENLDSVFHNDLYLLEMENGRWVPITLHGKESKDKKKRRRAKNETDETEECDEETEVVETLEKTTLSDDVTEVKLHKTKI